MEKRNNRKLVLAGIILLITFAGVLLAAFYGSKSIMPIIFFNAGLIFFVIIIFSLFRKGIFLTGIKEQKRRQHMGLPILGL